MPDKLDKNQEYGRLGQVDGKRRHACDVCYKVYVCEGCTEVMKDPRIKMRDRLYTHAHIGKPFTCPECVKK